MLIDMAHTDDYLENRNRAIATARQILGAFPSLSEIQFVSDRKAEHFLMRDNLS